MVRRYEAILAEQDPQEASRRRAEELNSFLLHGHAWEREQELEPDLHHVVSSLACTCAQQQQIRNQGSISIN